jgi:hypothetical protein
MTRHPYRWQASLLASLLLSSQVDAAWELAPNTRAGVVYESNADYNSTTDQTVGGTFLDLGGELRLLSEDNTLTLRPNFRSTNFLRENRDLGDKDFSINLTLGHTDRRGSIGMDTGYKDINVRTGEFESATPEDPDANPIPSGGSGRFADREVTQNEIYANPYLEYILSPRNRLRVDASLSDTNYDDSTSNSDSYLDYTYKTVDVSLTHSLNPQNSFSLSMNSGGFDAATESGNIRNTTDSFGVAAAYQYAYSPTLSFNARLGTSRNSAQQEFFGNAGRSTSSNLVGNFGIRQRTETATANLDFGRSEAPRSNGTKVSFTQMRLFYEKRFDTGTTGSFSALGLDEKAVGSFLQQDRRYFTLEGKISQRVASEWSLYLLCGLIRDSDTTDFGPDDTERNQRIFFGVEWYGTARRF